MQKQVLTFKASDDFVQHLQGQADKKRLKLGTFIKAVLKKHTKYKEPELV